MAKGASVLRNLKLLVTVGAAPYAGRTIDAPLMSVAPQTRADAAAGGEHQDQVGRRASAGGGVAGDAAQEGIGEGGGAHQLQEVPPFKLYFTFVH